MTDTINILVVDDQELVREGLKVLLNNQPNCRVIGEASDGQEALKIAREKKPNIVLMDIKMPNMDGLEATRRFTHSLPDIPVIVVTSYDEDPYPTRLIQTGAAGFMKKDCPFSELVDAIKMVSQGQRYVSSKIAQNLALRSVTMAKKKEGDNSSILAGLSKREMQVLLMISNGSKAQEIAKELCVTSKTINTYRYRLFKKLSVDSDVDLAYIAIRHNLVAVKHEGSDDSER